MTRSDIIIAKAEATSEKDKDQLIEIMHGKIENMYEMLFSIEEYAKKEKGYIHLAELMRRKLEA